MKTIAPGSHNGTTNELSKSDEALCTYFSIFGSLIAITCLIQFLVYSNYNFLSFVIIGVYVFNVLSYILLGLLRRFAPVLIFINTFLSFIIYIFYTYTYVFSVILILLFVCNAVATIMILVEKLPEKIKNKCDADRQEDEYWKEKL
jgi:hypothetical protein